jgi:FkbM family methyltransferase
MLCSYRMQSYSQIDSEGNYFDTKLDTLFQKKESGFYIELGANDGLDQSNTAFFEFYRGWTGLLIEPSPTAFQKCVQNRPKSICKQYACVSSDYVHPFVWGDFDGGMMSSIDGERTGKTKHISVKATTLETLLNELNPSQIDFLSLDVEGNELDVLKGINLQKHRPSYILVEVYNQEFESVISFLSSQDYKLLENFSMYTKTRNPYWDGQANDYLFKDVTI